MATFQQLQTEYQAQEAVMHQKVADMEAHFSAQEAWVKEMKKMKKERERLEGEHARYDAQSKQYPDKPHLFASKLMDIQKKIALIEKREKKMLLPNKHFELEQDTMYKMKSELNVLRSEEKRMIAEHRSELKRVERDEENARRAAQGLPPIKSWGQNLLDTLLGRK